MIVYLEISSWIGMSLGAMHFYGTMRTGYDNDGNHQKIDMRRPLTSAQAKELNKAHDVKFYKAGSLYQGYDTRDEIRQQALATYKDLFPGATILVEGSSAVADPQPILDGPKDIMDFVNELVRQAEEIGWYEGDYHGMDKIYREYSAFMKSRGL